MDWFSIGANVGIVVGLILVAVQIRQNNEMIRGSSYQMWVASNMEVNAAATQTDLSVTLNRGWMDSRELSDETFIQFAQWILMVMQMAQATDYLYRQGSLDQSLWEAEISRAALALSAPGVRQWWEAGGRTQLTPEFVALVESTTSTATTWGWTAEQGFVSILVQGD
jgi:hypothetical protein